MFATQVSPPSAQLLAAQGSRDLAQLATAANRNATAAQASAAALVNGEPSWVIAELEFFSDKGVVEHYAGDFGGYQGCLYQVWKHRGLDYRDRCSLGDWVDSSSQGRLSVSYTHLDVYKRQHRTSPAAPILR